MILRVVTSLVLLAALASSSEAVTGRDLRSRIRIDGFTSEFESDERIFGFNDNLGEPEERSNDSKWGENNDINQIRITWDQSYLYLAGEGRIWNNNMILFIDSVPNQGLGSMDSLNSWRRNFVFDTTGASRGGGFGPDLFCATWDGNTNPRLIMQERLQTVRDLEVSSGIFSASATFDQGNTGRSMEFAIPWNTVFLGPVGRGTRDTVILVGGVPDTVSRFPAGSRLRIAAVITAGPDGTGGPDSAPDNTRGHTDQSGDLVIVDNWATIDIDRQDDTGLGGGGPDGVADVGVSPDTLVTFRFQPPILATVSRSLRFSIRDVRIDHTAIRPDFGGSFRFRIAIDPPADPNNEYHQASGLNLRADMYDLRGRLVRSLFPFTSYNVLDLAGLDLPGWDGRDEQGRFVTPGVYVLRVEQKDIERVNRAIVVVR